MKLLPREITILDEIEKAARAGQPCPTNIELSHTLGAASTSAANNAVSRLQDLGLIKIERGSNWRVITILATGQHTAKPKPSRTNRKTEPTVKGPFPARVSRDTCFLCGTRMDLPSPRCARDHAMEMAA